MFGTEHSKTNQLQKPIEYKTNEQSAKYSYQNIRIDIRIRNLTYLVSWNILKRSSLDHWPSSEYVDLSINTD